MTIIRASVVKFSDIIAIIKNCESKGMIYIRHEDSEFYLNPGGYPIATKAIYFDDNRDQVTFKDLTEV